MVKMHKISLMATALILGGGMLQSASAQQADNAPPAYDLDASPRYQEPAPVMPAPLPRSNFYAGSESAPPSRSSDATPGSPASRLMQVRIDQGIRYITGGVGEGERAELNALSNQFNLRLMFAMQGSGEYLSAVRVNILDSHGGSVLSVESKGPWFLAQLPPGDYVVEASATDQASQQPQRKTAHIEGSGQSRLDFYWR
ncbi:MAG: carboxypeptidase regulatory-like domain-containing protein [Candidatus Competibacteraceae bacterium]|nr:carboxypeptidase regulatory-like domain-containing protein [Candidatus Competibacteraceae bacterium]